MVQELLAGRTIHDQITDEFNFIERYGFADKARTRARKLIENSLQYEYDVGIVRIVDRLRRYRRGIRGGRADAHRLNFLNNGSTLFRWKPSYSRSSTSRSVWP